MGKERRRDKKKIEGKKMTGGVAVLKRRERGGEEMLKV